MDDLLLALFHAPYKLLAAMFAHYPLGVCHVCGEECGAHTYVHEECEKRRQF